MNAIEWTGPAMDDLAALERIVAQRIQRAVERLAATGAGDVRRLQGIDPPEYRLREGDFRVRFQLVSATIRVLRVLNRPEAYR
jgi:mRNA-degrading endonuclease RelE of RelBE toxin-antitoxin system